MLSLDTCVVLASLTPESHSGAASQFLESAAAPLAISNWTITELHSALGLKIRKWAGAHHCKQLCSFDRVMVTAAVQLGFGALLLSG